MWAALPLNLVATPTLRLYLAREKRADVEDDENNIFDYLTEVGDKWKTIINFSFIMPIQSFLRIEEVQSLYN